MNIHEEIEEEYNLTHTGTRVVAPKLDLHEIRDGAAEFKGHYVRAAYLLRKLITTHLFEDGNKRTAWATTEIYLARNDAEPAERNEPVEQVLRRIRRYDIDEIANWLEAGDIDRSRLNP
ncbi:death on curing protein [Halorientalis persicus]|uniref:Death on curing protein n=1 Tax=Halorientalis persicus TaxID=1367881 RepID=A0A1H8VKJ6_9EURY|nr:Fic family protein [Halorientalis persicus]SEP15972.1 death on curing protein [Halorientalis persicus]